MGRKGFLGKALGLGFDPNLDFDPKVRPLTQKSAGRSLPKSPKFYAE